MPVWEASLKSKTDLLPFMGQASGSISQTTNTEIARVTPSNGYIAYLEGVRLQADASSVDSGVTVHIEIWAEHEDGSEALATLDLSAGEKFDDWLRFSYDALGSNNSKVKSIVVYGYLSGNSNNPASVTLTVTGVIAR